jgi:hypothetical protein
MDENHILTLVKMVRETLVERCGTVLCRVPTDGNGVGIVLPLRDRKLRSSLIYRFFKEHGKHPKTAAVNAALDHIEGEQVAKLRLSDSVSKDPVWKCFKQLLEGEPEGAASAGDLLQKLRGINRTHKLLQGKEALPEKPIHMGFWMRKHQTDLLHLGLHVSRPPRKASTRLWSWSQIDPDDKSDTSLLDPSVTAEPINTMQQSPDDTLSKAKMREEFGDLLDGDGT